ncbi:MAG: DGQHR domain-containing protein [Actinobacteria bacterium]|nr:DGQHR domain-containing protein [Actinomycetota bacterium]
MLDGLLPRTELGGLAARRRKAEEFRTVPASGADELVAAGWEIDQHNRRTVRLKRPKPKHRLFEDRVWSVMYRLGFEHLSGPNGTKLSTQSSGAGSKQVDVVAVDQEVALAIECKSSSSSNGRHDVAAYVDQLAGNREHFSRDVKAHLQDDAKRLHLLIVALWGIRVTERERERAKDQRVILLDERELSYFEQLADHLGPASRHQFLASIAPGSRVEGLKVRVPALRSQTAGRTCYTFSIRADYLLKIAYVSHRAGGGAEDVDTYQRMIQKARLRRLREFISEGGLFPTNVVLSIAKGRGTRFEKGADAGGQEGATYGFLSLAPSFGSAWVIDGQHRLFAYSGHELAGKSFLNVVAYEDLAPSEQAQMFITINHEQKSVKRSLLQELYAELVWDSTDEAERVSAVLSKAIRVLNERPDSPLCGRVLLADDRRTAQRCISLTGLFGALSAPGVFIIRA